MKKILTASLVAMMAVTAANADIASTKYVTDQTGASETGTFTFTNAAKDATTLQGAVNAIADSLAANMGTGGNVETQISNKIDAFEEGVIGDVAEGKTVTDMISDAQAAAEGKVTALENGQVTTNKNDIAGLKTSKLEVSTYNTDKAAMKLDATGGAGSFIQQVSQADGTVAATATAFVTTVDGTTKDSVIAPTTKAIKSYVDTQIGATTQDLTGLQNTVTEQDTAIKALTKTVGDNKTAADATQTELTNYKAANDKALADYKTEAASTFMDSEEVGAAITAAVTNTETGALKNYSTTAQMNAAIADANSTQTEEITNAYTAADTALETALKKYSDDKDTAQTTALHTYADQAEADAIAAAKNETTTQVNALKNGQVQTNTTNIGTITTNLGGLNGVAIPAACESGRCALVMEAGKAKWETINY